MDTNDSPYANLPARLPDLGARMPMVPSLPSRELAPSPSSSVTPRVLWRGLTRHWWRILLLWLIISAPTVYGIYAFIKPSYEASSILRIEPSTPELFNQGQSGNHDSTFDRYLETQINYIKSAQILKMAISQPNVANSGFVKESIRKGSEPYLDLLNILEVRNIPKSYFIRVAVSLPNNQEASEIVNAVVLAYQAKNVAFQRGVNNSLKKNFQDYLNDKDKEINDKKAKLNELVKKGTLDFSKPTLSSGNDSATGEPSIQTAFKDVTVEQFRRLNDQLLQTDIELIEKQAILQTKIAETQVPTDRPGSEVAGAQLQELIVGEFRHDPEVASTIQQIEEFQEQLEHSKSVARKGHDPARQAIEKKLKALRKKHDELWVNRYDDLRRRVVIQTMAPGSTDAMSLETLRSQVETLRKSREALVELINKWEVRDKESNSDAYQATFLKAEIDRLVNMNEAVAKKLEQLRFETEREFVRIEVVDAAIPSKVPTKSKRLTLMLLTPAAALLLSVALFLLMEIKAERVGDPDSLSTRVQSEVYSLPPLPTARKLKGAISDDQIDRFIQRLDHLRFAVCGENHEHGLGRCVLITSAIGGEGKTTLAAQLAARCGNAGVNTLLIDADLRRASLCPLLDVPEGAGLSDALKDGAPVQDLVIPVQGGAFHLLGAGTPVQDTSRILQGRNFGMLITQLRQMYDVIIIDSPPILPVPDALILGRWCDGAILAARYDVSRSPQVERARKQLDTAGIAVLGTVINGMRASDAYYGRYTYRRQRNDSDLAATNGE